MCYVGRLKGSKWEAGSQNRCKNLANTRLDLRNAANSLQIEGKGGCYLETHPIRGGTSRAEDGIIYIYIYIYTYIYIYASAQLSYVLYYIPP